MKKLMASLLILVFVSIISGQTNITIVTDESASASIASEESRQNRTLAETGYEGPCRTTGHTTENRTVKTPPSSSTMFLLGIVPFGFVLLRRKEF